MGKRLSLMTGDTVVRKGDGKEFKVTWLGHWSDVEAADGEKQSIKFYGPGWVGVNGGHFDIKDDDDAQ